MEIRKAETSEFAAARAFYHSLIDAIAGGPYDIGWEKDVYPAPEFLHDSIANGELYLGLEEGGIAASMVLNHQHNEGYRRVKWPTRASDAEVLVIHALGVHPDFGGRGYAKQMVRAAVEAARDAGMRAIRLDVLGGNVPAERLYRGMGFKYVDTVPMYYEDTGWTDYLLYEYAL